MKKNKKVEKKIKVELPQEIKECQKWRNYSIQHPFKATFYSAISLLCVSLVSVSVTSFCSFAYKEISKFSVHSFKDNTFGILVTEFEGEIGIGGKAYNGKETQQSIRNALNARFKDEKIADAETQDYPDVIKTKEEARKIGRKYNAELVIWGSNNIQGIIPILSLIKSDSGGKLIIDSDTPLLKNELSSFALTATPDIKFTAITDEPASLAYFIVGLKYFQNRLFEKSVSYFLKALPSQDSKINSAPIYELLGIGHYLLKKYDDAINAFTKSIEFNPSDSISYNNRGTTYIKKGDYFHAVSDYNEAVKFDSNNAIAYYNMGTVYAIKGNHDEAISNYNKTIEIDSSNCYAYGNRGVAHLKNGAYDQAISDLTKAIELKPDYALAYYNIGSAYFNRGLENIKKGDHDQSILNLTKAIEFKPTHIKAYYVRGLEYIKNSDYLRGISDFKKVIELDPNNMEAYNNLGLANIEKGDPDQGVLDLTKAIELKPDYALAHHNRGYGYYKKQDYNNAWTDVHNAEKYGLKINPDFLSNLKKISGREQ